MAPVINNDWSMDMNNNVDVCILQRKDGRYTVEVNVTVNGVTVSPVVSLIADTVTCDEKTAETMDVV